MEAVMLASLKKKETYVHYFKTLKFALYCMTHPLDGYWDLTHEKRGSIAAANTILILTLVARLFRLQYTSFLFQKVYWEGINIFFGKYCFDNSSNNPELHALLAVSSKAP